MRWMSCLHNRNRLIQTKFIIHFQRRRKRVLRLVNQILLLHLFMLPHYRGIIKGQLAFN
ncbi:hypothetical protein Goari_019785 [Gossypium aridum]|uniref:Uncharacterized protein n=1 Tax=Gossypium aridum TaxID=34290 RepID=A0A7J8WTS1_GOSAI|nr:hypothetical protein [Gossypium aridum]